MFKSRYELTTPLFNRLKLLNLNNIVNYMSLLFVFKSIQSEGPLFTRYPENNYYNTRATTMSSLQMMPNIFSTHSRRGVRWTGAGLWNWLPADLRKITNYSTFKIIVKKHLLAIQEDNLQNSWDLVSQPRRGLPVLPLPND